MKAPPVSKDSWVLESCLAEAGLAICPRTRSVAQGRALGRGKSRRVKTHFSVSVGCSALPHDDSCVSPSHHFFNPRILFLSTNMPLTLNLGLTVRKSASTTMAAWGRRATWRSNSTPICFKATSKVFIGRCARLTQRVAKLWTTNWLVASRVMRPRTPRFFSCSYLQHENQSPSRAFGHTGNGHAKNGYSTNGHKANGQQVPQKQSPTMPTSLPDRSPDSGFVGD